MREKDVCHHCGADKRDMARLTRELDEARRLHMGQAGRAAGWRARARYAREALERLIELVADDPEAKDTTTPLCAAVTVARAEVTAIEEAERRDADRSTPPLELTVREAARQRVPLDGADAQALEGAMALTERERDEAREEAHELTQLLARKAKIDPLHPNGRCRCAGEGQCEWCQRTEARDELDGIAEVLDAAGVPQVTDGPDGRRWTLGLGARVEHVIAERDEARAEVEELRTRTAAQLEIETRARDAARAEVEKLRALPSAEDLEERAHEILDGAGIPTHAFDPVSGEENYQASLEERLEWTVEEITLLRRALEPFAHFGAAVLLVDGGSGKWHSIRVEGHEYTISREDFRRARAALAKARGGEE